MGGGGPTDSGELFRSHAAFVARFLARLGVAREDIDDVLQEVFLVVAHSGFDPARGVRPTTYLGSIAVRAASTYRRRRGRRVARRAEPRQLANVEAGNPDPVQTVELNERLRLVQHAIDGLDDDLRGIFVLFEFEGESCDAIASAFEIPVGTVYSRLHRARQRVRATIDGAAGPPTLSPPAALRKVHS